MHDGREGLQHLMSRLIASPSQPLAIPQPSRSHSDRPVRSRIAWGCYFMIHHVKKDYATREEYAVV